MKRSFLSILFALMLTLTVGAENLTGRVVDANGQPMPYVTISVMQTDSTIVSGATTDDGGQFAINGLTNRQYIVCASFVGYESVCRDLSLPAEHQHFVLNEETEQLKEVEVKAKKQLVERHMDKLVLNVANSPLAAGTNGKDLLKKAPGVLVDKDGNITVNGKSVDVYIDGRPSYLSGQQLKAMLEGTDGSTIEKIEIISNPSAKYDASGTGGIINIKTKRNMMKGLNGMISAGYGGMYFKKFDKWTNMEYVALNLNYRTEKTYTYVNLTQVYADMAVDVDAETVTPLQSRISKSAYDIAFQSYMLKVGNDWMIDKQNTIGFIVNVPVSNMTQSVDNGKSISYTLQGQDTTEWNVGGTSTRMLTPQHSLNLNYTHVFCDSLDRELTVNADYNRFLTNNYNLQSYDYRYADGTTRKDGLDILTNQNVNIYSAKLDFQTAFWKTGMIETGVKYAFSSTDNQMTTDSLYAAPDTSSFTYGEHVAAAYITVGKQFFDRLSVKVGLRGEYTFSNGNWISADSTTKKSYFDIFPTAFLGYTTKPLGKPALPIMMSASYTRRIKRPSYYQLNPFKTYIDAHNYSTGNTELAPEYNNDVELNFSYSQYLSLTGTFSHTQDMQSRQTMIMDNGDGVMRWLNFGTCTTHGASLSLTELPIVPKFDEEKNLQGAWLALTVNAGYYHFVNRSYAKLADGTPEYQNDNHYFSFSGNLNAYLPKNWTLSVDGWYSAPMTIGYNYTHAQGGMTAGIRKMFPEKGLILNLQVQDVLRSTQQYEESMGLPEGQSTKFCQDITQQHVMLAVTYMFGTQQWHKQRKVGSVDEASRLGGGSGVGGN